MPSAGPPCVNQCRSYCEIAQGISSWAGPPADPGLAKDSQMVKDTPKDSFTQLVTFINTVAGLPGIGTQTATSPTKSWMISSEIQSMVDALNALTGAGLSIDLTKTNVLTESASVMQAFSLALFVTPV